MTLECINCGKQLHKRVCITVISGDVIMHEDSDYECEWCSKKCAKEWVLRNTAFEFYDVALLEESRVRR